MINGYESAKLYERVDRYAVEIYHRFHEGETESIVWTPRRSKEYTVYVFKDEQKILEKECDLLCEAIGIINKRH